MTLATARHPFSGSNSAQIDAWIDILDRTEPGHFGWREPFGHLKEELERARKVRRFVRDPIAALAVITQGVDFVVQRLTTDSYGPTIWALIGIALWAAFLICGYFLRRQFPILHQEGRVATLLRYYGARDVSEREELY